MKIEIPNERFYSNDDDAPTPNIPLCPGVSAVIFDSQSRILIMKRTRSEYWSLPGGRIDLDESAQNCCIRESFEETGLKTRIIRLISLNTNPSNVIHYPDGNVHRSFVACFEAEVVSGELKISGESEDFRWMAKEEIESIKLIPDSVANALDAWQGAEAAFIR